MPADCSQGAEVLTELVRQIECGAVLVVGGSCLEGEPSRMVRLVRRMAPLLLRNAVRIPGVSDVVSGFAAFRLMTLRNAFRTYPGPLLTTEGWAANAELYTRAALSARRVETIEAVERRDIRSRPSRLAPMATARELWRAGPRLKAVTRAVNAAESRPGRQPTEMI
jgi:hypothetical protein